jgi:hypothetical protein
MNLSFMIKMKYCFLLFPLSLYLDNDFIYKCGLSMIIIILMFLFNGYYCIQYSFTAPCLLLWEPRWSGCFF